MSNRKNSALVINEPSNKQGKSCELVLGKSLTLEALAPEMDTLFQVLEKHTEFRVISDEDIASIDLGGLQMLLFIDKYCKALEKSVQFKLQTAKKTGELLYHSGFGFLIDHN